MRASIVIPCFNEEKNIDRVLTKLEEIKEPSDEVIVMDDGSTDDTAKVARKHGVRVIAHSKNKGKGVSIREGIVHAKYNIVLFLDGDGQDDPGDIPKLLKAIGDGADFVIGSRWLGELKEGAISKLNFLVTSAISASINLLFRANITDSQAGFRCIRKNKVRSFELRARGYDIETEMLIKAIKNKLKIVEVPVTRWRRYEGESQMKRLRLGTKIIAHMLRELLLE